MTERKDYSGFKDKWIQDVVHFNLVSFIASTVNTLCTLCMSKSSKTIVS